MNRELNFFQALNEAADLCMAKDPAVYIMGLGVPDPKGIFGTTLGLQQKYGSMRVMDMPVSEMEKVRKTLIEYITISLEIEPCV